ncbi:perilipin-2-like isoform X1 [Thunnus maccoyii]|uniref:perilipin-2-like isoform X1 n=1 Tax=Thunnus maccoyii TaxID=8240 RepID=UPI001C4D5E82|nr:perilipin-2-like isoform X1 [Thunnus maccoyii]
MPTNNNQKVPSAAARLAKLPMVRSACAKLSVLYIDTKCSHPSLRSVCEVLENSVTALGTVASDRMSPVIVKLEPQISIANDVACKSLDWFETTFPVLHTPTEQIVVGAKNKMLEIRDVVNIVANGTMECVQHTVAWVIERMQQVDEQANHAVVERAISVVSVGLDTALNISEALMDRVLPPTEEEKEEEARLEGFEAATLRRSYPVRLVTFTAKLCRRTYHKAGAKMQSVEVCCQYSFTRDRVVMETLSRSSGLLQDLQTSWLALAWSLQGLPQYLQHQVFFFISQMYNLGCHSSQQNHSSEDRSCLKAAEASSVHKDVVKIPPQVPPNYRMRRPTKMSVFENGCNIKGCLNR